MEMESLNLKKTPVLRAMAHKDATRIYAAKSLFFCLMTGPPFDLLLAGIAGGFCVAVSFFGADLTVLGPLLVLPLFSSSLVFFTRREMKGKLKRQVKRGAEARGRYSIADMIGELEPGVLYQIAAYGQPYHSKHGSRTHE
jgi:hypothetical protein